MPLPDLLDGLVDCDDPHCLAIGPCPGELCNDAEDNDGDGMTDCADSVGQGLPSCITVR